MSEDDSRTINDDGTQREGEMGTGGGRSSRGPALSAGGDQEPGGVVPPYDGRTESMDASTTGSMQDGVRVGGATGAVEDDEFKAPLPADTPGGRTVTPADEQPAELTPDGAAPDEGSDETGTHIPGAPKGHKGGA